MAATTQHAVPAAALERLDALAAARGVTLVADAPLAPLTTLRVGGPADRMTTAVTTEELIAAIELAREARVPVGVLGKGSDVVVADGGVRGLVIRNRADEIEVAGTTVRAGAGAAMATIVKRCTAEGLSGIEFGISIPGSLGGAVWANAGAHGGEMKDVVVAVDVVGPSGGVERLPNESCRFAYRESRFKASGEVVLGAELRLEAGRRDEVAARVSAHQAQRRATQPLADQNAGSVFRNPPGDHAGRLIDAAGLKAFRIGSAEVSPLHANFIVVDRGGRAADVRRVGDHARAVVAERFGVTLEYEIEFIGDWSPDEPWATSTGALAGGS